MLIKKLIMENFRQYVGKHEIKFSTDKEKNVTLLIGDNGTGKTTISQAFLWCLYGETPGFLKKESLLSQTVEDAIYANGVKQKISVAIEMEHFHIPYTITRSIEFYRELDSVKLNKSSNQLAISCIKKGETVSLSSKDVEKTIYEILPKALSEYFFLTGEKIDSMSEEIKKGRSKDFAKAVKALLDLDFYGTAIKHLKRIKDDYNKEDFSGMDDEIAALNKKIDASDANEAQFKNKIDESEKSVSYFDERIIELKAELLSKKSSHDLQKEKEACESELLKKQKYVEIEQKEAIKSFIKEAPYFFAKKSFLNAMQTLKENLDLKTDDIPDRLHADTIQWVEKHKKCICGAKIEEGTKEFDCLESWRRIVPPEAIGTLVKNEKSKIIDKFRAGKDLYESLERTNDRVETLHNEIDDKENKINDLTEAISRLDDTSSLQKELTDNENKKKDAEQELGVSRNMLARIQNDKNANIEEREKLLSKSKEGRKIVAYKEMTEKLIAGFEKFLANEEGEKRNRLVTAVKEAFVEIYGTSFSVDIDENYRISADSSLEKSTGQGMSVIYAFLAGLLYVIKTDEKRKIASSENANESLELESYPLVLDAPFSALDKTRISMICKVLPKVSEQVIILIKDTDGDEAKARLAGKIGECYELKKVGNKDNKTKIVKKNLEV